MPAPEDPRPEGPRRPSPRGPGSEASERAPPGAPAPAPQGGAEGGPAEGAVPSAEAGGVEPGHERELADVDRLTAALAALDGGADARAAELLAALADGPIASESEHWRSIALERAGDLAASERVLVAYLERFPRGPRAEEIELRLAVREAGSGRATSARARLARLASSARPEIAALARAWLERLAR